MAKPITDAAKLRIRVAELERRLLGIGERVEHWWRCGETPTDVQLLELAKEAKRAALEKGGE